jgi:predicted ATPase/Tfp pilus assembly protein PilF
VASELNVLTGTRLLHYDIHELLGSGSSGAVYRAIDTRLDRPVALKFLQAGIRGNAAAIERLRAEAKAAARLDHPNIGSVYAIEHAPDGGLFISMAFYPGETLGDLVSREGRLPLPTALDITRQVLRGLERAHAAGVVHRDIKPANVIILPDGLVKILDFGLAKAADMLVDGWSEALIGTVEYMSPQQVRGDDVDHRTDIWAVGALLYRMLHGVSPFFDDEGPYAMIYKIATREPAKLADIHPDLSPASDVILQRALQKPLNRRYRSVSEFLQDLDLMESGERASSKSGPGLALKPRRSDGVPNNLPARLPLLLGREDELKVIDLYLGEAESRAVSIVGPGGIGKTALALHAALRQQRELRFLHGVFFVSLDSVPRPELIAATIAQAIDCKLEGMAPPSLQVARVIEDKHMLLVLDGVEHLTAGMEFVHQLPNSCPHLKLLLTSRERPNLADEWIVGLQGLSLPPEGVDAPEEALRFDSIALFNRQAQRASHGFEMDGESLPNVVSICRMVQGHPLGIELAAGWVRHLSAERIAAEIRESHDFLASGTANVKARHLSIRAVFEHSWGLLDQPEQEALMKVSIFRGHFSEEAAVAVASTPLTTLAELVDKSLMQVSDDQRFEQHPLWRQYSREKLMAHPHEFDIVLQRHARHYMEHLLRHGARLRLSDQGPEMALIEDEIENIRLAWETTVDARDAKLIAQASEPLRTFFDLKGRAGEGGALLRQAHAAMDSNQPDERMAVGHLSAQLAWLTLPSGKVDEAEELARNAVTILGEHDETRGLYWAVNSLGAASAQRGEFATARQHFGQCQALAESLGERALLSASVDNLAGTEQALGDVEKARSLYESALEVAREDGNSGQIIATLNNLGALLVSLKCPSEAKPLLLEGLDLSRRSGIERGVPFFLANLGEVSYLLGEYAEAANAYQEGIERARQTGNRWLECAFAGDLARVAAFLNDIEQAQSLFLSSLELAEELKDDALFLHAARCFVEAMKSRTRADAVALARIVVAHPQSHPEDRSVCEALSPMSDEPLPDGPHQDGPLAGWKEVVHGAISRMYRNA